MFWGAGGYEIYQGDGGPCFNNKLTRSTCVYKTGINGLN